jgi:hypothetical protein
MPDSSATPRAARRHGSYAVYHKTTGDVVYVLHVELMEGASAPPQTDIERQAVISASQASSTDEASLAVLAINPADVKPGAMYAVHLKTRKLVEKPTPKRPRKHK